MPKIPGTQAAQSHVIPTCSSCKSKDHVQRNEKGAWFCVVCADDWLKSYVESKVRSVSVGGVALPIGAVDERRQTPSFTDLLPNRRARRRVKKR
jgi:hypothetical protein